MVYTPSRDYPGRDGGREARLRRRCTCQKLNALPLTGDRTHLALLRNLWYNSSVRKDKPLSAAQKWRSAKVWRRRPPQTHSPLQRPVRRKPGATGCFLWEESRSRWCSDGACGRGAGERVSLSGVQFLAWLVAYGQPRRVWWEWTGEGWRETR